MIDEDLPKQHSHEFPRHIEALSIEDLKEYIKSLEDEILRVNEDIKAKKASQDAANSIFK